MQNGTITRDEGCMVVFVVLAVGLTWLIFSALREARAASDRYDEAEESSRSSAARDP
jgi:hypothetical protein